jgi:hypothetical protein
MNHSQVTEDIVELDAPDYAALVIEWNDVSARDADQTIPMRMPYLTPEAHHTIATLVGALGALVFATWGLYRLRTS